MTYEIRSDAAVLRDLPASTTPLLRRRLAKLPQLLGVYRLNETCLRIAAPNKRVVRAAVAWAIYWCGERTAL